MRLNRADVRVGEESKLGMEIRLVLSVNLFNLYKYWITFHNKNSKVYLMISARHRCGYNTLSVVFMYRDNSLDTKTTWTYRMQSVFVTSCDKTMSHLVTRQCHILWQVVVNQCHVNDQIHTTCDSIYVSVTTVAGKIETWKSNTTTSIWKKVMSRLSSLLTHLYQGINFCKKVTLKLLNVD